MVKIPATAEGVGAIQAMIAEGRNINVTLIFSLDRYAEVMEAYIARPRAVRRRRPAPTCRRWPAWPASSSAGSTPRSTVGSTRSARPRRSRLRGKGAVAQGKLAYQLFQKTFSGPRWEALAAQGAAVQRPLWASTSTKNPAYPDTLYVDELIGPDTVNTLPDATIEAFADHGTLARTRRCRRRRGRRPRGAALADVGVDLDDVADTLEREGVTSFQKSFDELLGALDDEGRRAARLNLPLTAISQSATMTMPSIDELLDGMDLGRNRRMARAAARSRPSPCSPTIPTSST